MPNHINTNGITVKQLKDWPEEENGEPTEVWIMTEFMASSLLTQVGTVSGQNLLYPSNYDDTKPR